MSAAAASQPVLWQRVATAMGFHVPVVAFALRTAVAAFAAIAVAYALGLEHPNWAAMSAWASSQPMREHLLSRSMHRLFGSIVGVIYAVALVLLAQDSIWVLGMGVAVAGAVCAFFGNLQRGYMVYGWMLAGYSAAMVVLLHQGPVNAIWPFALDRSLTVVIGVLAALCICWCFAPKRKTAVLIAQSRNALAGVLQATAARLRLQAAPEGLDKASLISRLAEVEELLELYPEGSRAARQTAKAMHWQQHCAMEVVYHLGQTQLAADGRAPSADSIWRFTALEGEQVQPQVAHLADSLQTLAQALQKAPVMRGEKSVALQQVLQQAIAAAEAVVAGVLAAGKTVQPGMNALYQLLQELRRGQRTEAQDLSAEKTQSRLDQRAQVLPLHRDWVGAREAAIRAGGTLMVCGVVWALTGSRLVSFGMLGLAVMLLVFSSFESPTRTMAFVLRGQVIGAVLALLCQALVWPWAQTGWQVIWMMLPFVLLAALVFAHTRTMAGALDTNMAMFILLAPTFPEVHGLTKSLSMAAAVVSGPALAWLVYRWVYPTNAQHRMRTLARMMLDEVPALARRLLGEGQPTPWMTPSVHNHGSNWQAQLHHRVLRLVRWADKTRMPSRTRLPDMGMSLRAMQSSMWQLQCWRRSTILATPVLRRTERLAQLALLRTVVWGQAPQHAAASVKARAAWQALAQQGCLPPFLVGQALRVAERDIPELDAARKVFS